jgi:hypothetical protein
MACVFVIVAVETHIHRGTPRGATGGLLVDVERTRGATAFVETPRAISRRESFNARINARDGGVPSQRIELAIYHYFNDAISLMK